MDPGEGPRGLPTHPLPLFLDQSEARGVEKKFLGDRPHLFSKGLDDRRPLRVIFALSLRFARSTIPEEKWGLLVV